jgi:hypothetical protein
VKNFSLLVPMQHFQLWSLVPATLGDVDRETLVVGSFHYLDEKGIKKPLQAQEALQVI